MEYATQIALGTTLRYLILCLIINLIPLSQQFGTMWIWSFENFLVTSHHHIQL